MHFSYTHIMLAVATRVYALQWTQGKQATVQAEIKQNPIQSRLFYLGNSSANINGVKTGSIKKGHISTR
jgi:hypothetical protein